MMQKMPPLERKFEKNQNIVKTQAELYHESQILKKDKKIDELIVKNQLLIKESEELLRKCQKMLKENQELQLET